MLCRTEVEEAADQSGIEMAGPQVELVTFDKLPNHINRKVRRGLHDVFIMILDIITLQWKCFLVVLHFEVGCWLVELVVVMPPSASHLQRLAH